MNLNVVENRTTCRILARASATALAMTVAMALSQPARAGQVEPPDVPFDIQVPAGNLAYLKGQAVGTQNYVCSPAGTGFARVLFTPEATLSNRADKRIITHFFSPSPNPDPRDVNTDPRVVADGAIRAAWQARDTSTVWLKVSDLSRPVIVRPDSVPWLLLETVGVQ